MRRIVLLLVGVLVASGLAASPSAAADTSLRGRVVDADGQPLAGVTVDMWLKTSDGRFDALSAMVTNAEGRFYVWTGAFGDAQVRLRFTDPEGRVPPEFYSDARDLASATDIDVGTVDVDLGDVELGVASHITGRLLADDGAPLTNGVAFVYTGVPGSWDLVGRDYTDLDGTYDVGGLVAGTYRIRFVDYDGERFEEVYEDAATLDDGTDIRLAEAETRTGIDAVLTTTSTIAGRVTDALGEPLRGISVHVHELVDGQWQRRNIDYGTDSDGYYEVYDLRAASSYRLQFEDLTQHRYHSEFFDDAPDVGSATSIEMPAVATRVWVEDVQLGRDASIQGTLTDPDGGAAQSTVTAYRVVDGVRVAAGSDVTDYLGRYDLRGLTPGAYVVEVADSGELLGESVALTLAAEEQRAGLDFQLAEAPLSVVAAPTLTIYGDPTKEGSSTLEVTRARWSLYPRERTIVWLRDGVEVPGDGTTYFLSATDRGHVFTARESVVSTFGQTASAESAEKRIPVAPPPSRPPSRPPRRRRPPLPRRAPRHPAPPRPRPRPRRRRRRRRWSSPPRSRHGCAASRNPTAKSG